MEYLLNKTEDKELNQEESGILKEIDEFKDGFIQAMEDDINTADAVASIFELVKYTNTNFNENTPKPIIEKTYKYLMELSKVLGILTKKDEILEEEIIDLINKRTEARKNKEYKLADEIRDKLKDRGILLEDTPNGVKWKRI